MVARAHPLDQAPVISCRRARKWRRSPRAPPAAAAADRDWPRALGGACVRAAAHLVHHATEGLVELGARHRALLQRFLHAGAQLRLIERLAPPVALDHHRHEELGRFEGGEALATLEALAAPADLAALAGEARVGHLGLDVAAERTVHAASVPRATARTPGSARTARAPGAAPARSPPPLLPPPAPRR